MTEKELKILLYHAERRGIDQGIRLFQEKMLLACEKGTPIEIDGRAFFIKSDIQNLHSIIAELETDTD